MVDKVRFAFTEVNPELGALSTLPYSGFHSDAVQNYIARCRGTGCRIGVNLT